jgi:hypothetical protein
MSSFSVRRNAGVFGVWFRAALAALLLVAWPVGSALAQAVTVTANGPNTISATELSGTDLRVSYSLLGQQFTGDVLEPANAPDQWGVGPHFANFVTPSTPNNGEVVGRVYWLEPGSSLDDLPHALFNGFKLGSCFCNAQGPNVEFASDITWSTLTYIDASNPWGLYGCVFGLDTGFTSCPILQNGQSYTLPVSYYDANANLTPADPLTVTFNDQGDISQGVPEPSAWVLMIAGFGLAGARLRRRRSVPA